VLRGRFIENDLSGGWSKCPVVKRRRGKKVLSVEGPRRGGLWGEKRSRVKPLTLYLVATEVGGWTIGEKRLRGFTGIG